MVAQGARLDAPFALVAHMRVHGWKWDDVCLESMIDQLRAEDISMPRHLCGVDINDIEGAANWPVDIREFMTKLCQARRHVFSTE